MRAENRSRTSSASNGTRGAARRRRPSRSCIGRGSGDGPYSRAAACRRASNFGSSNRRNSRCPAFRAPRRRGSDRGTRPGLQLRPSRASRCRRACWVSRASDTSSAWEIRVSAVGRRSSRDRPQDRRLLGARRLVARVQRRDAAMPGGEAAGCAQVGMVERIGRGRVERPGEPRAQKPRRVGGRPPRSSASYRCCSATNADRLDREVHRLAQCRVGEQPPRRVEGEETHTAARVDEIPLLPAAAAGLPGPYCAARWARAASGSSPGT